MADSPSKWVENTVGKGEIAGYEQFPLFLQCFQKTCTAGLNTQREKPFENIVGKGENAGLQHFLLFIIFHHFTTISNTNFIFFSLFFFKSVVCKCFNFDQSKNLSIAKGLVSDWLTEEKQTKHAEFTYLLTKLISSDTPGSYDRFVEHRSHKMTVHQTGISDSFKMCGGSFEHAQNFPQGHSWTKSRFTR